MEILIIIGQFVLSLSILVVLHEAGHFIPAKLFKTKVEKFYLFFDPWFSLVKKKIGDTEYGIGWLPLGGYVKISGMIDESMDKEQMAGPPQPWEFRSKPGWQRLIIMLGGVTVNFLLGFLIFGLMLFGYGEETLPSKNLKYGIGVDSIAYEMGLRDGDQIVRIGQQPFETFNPGTLIREIVDQLASVLYDQGRMDEAIDIQPYVKALRSKSNETINVAAEALGTTALQWEGNAIDVGPAFRRWKLEEAVRELNPQISVADCRDREALGHEELASALATSSRTWRAIAPLSRSSGMNWGRCSVRICSSFRMWGSTDSGSERERSGSDTAVWIIPAHGRS